MSAITQTRKRRYKSAYRNEKIRNPPLVLFPCFAVFGLTFLNISQRSMRYHNSKEQRIEPWKGAIEAGDEAPSQCEEQICRVMYLACIPIYNRVSMPYCHQLARSSPTPSIYQNRVASLGLDEFWVLDRLPRELRKRSPFHQRPTFLMPESILLTICCIPHPIHEKVQNIE